MSVGITINKSCEFLIPKVYISVFHKGCEYFQEYSSPNVLKFTFKFIQSMHQNFNN